MRNALISGAGIGGPVAAWFLARAGFAVTVVERAPGLREGGQAVDIRGAALDVVDRMGLTADVRALRTRMRGMSVVDGSGAELFRSRERVFSSGRLDSADVELVRDDLVSLLYKATSSDVEYVFGDSITALDQLDHGVRVSFEHGGFRTFDVVLGADGLHSAVRRLAFGPEERFARHLGQYLAIFPAPNYLGLDNWQLWFRAGETGGAVYPVHDNRELRVTLGFSSPPLPYGNVVAQKELVATRLSGVGWEVPRLLSEMAGAPNFYFDAMQQIVMNSWTTGRIALLGDAACCASPLSGQGTSLALVGACVLATELTHHDVPTAFAAYEHRMRPFVLANQALATENPAGPASEASVTHAKNAITLP